MSKEPTSTGDEVEEKRRKTRERVRRHRERQRAASASKSGHDAGSERAIERLPEGERDLIDRYLNARRLKLLSSSRSAYESDLAEFSAYLGVKGLLGASYGDIQVYLSERTREEEDDPDDTRPWSLRTAHRKLSSFNQFYRWALREELIAGSPAAGQELRRPPKRDPLRLSLGDWERMIDHVEDRILLEDDARRRDLYLLDSLILRLMYHLALRVSEAHGLHLSRTYREDGELLIRVRRKGAGILSYPLAGRVLHAYDRWMSRRSEIRIDPGHRDFVCIHPWTGRRTTRKRAYNRIRKIARDAGLPAEIARRISPHALRHAQGYLSAARGESITDVQAKLGHASIRSTQIYTEHDEAERRRLLRRASERD